MAKPTYFRLAPELRRSAVYMMAGCVPLSMVAFWVDHFVLNQPLVSAFGRSGAICLLGLAMFLPLRWALRVDEEGVARRRFLDWDLWKWSDFSSGRVEKRYPYTMVDPRRPRWRRSLSIGNLSHDDRRQVLELINRHYVFPDLPELPERLEIKYNIGRSMTLDAKGIQVLARGKLRAHQWSEVRRIHVLRTDPVSRHFRSLEIVLPEEEIALRMITHEYGTSPSWRGPTSEVISEFLASHVPPDRIAMDLVGQSPVVRIDAESALEKSRRTCRKFDRNGWGMLLLFTGFLAWDVFANGVPHALIMGAMATIPIVPIYFFIRRDLCRQRRELGESLNRFPEEDNRCPTDVVAQR